MSIGFVAILILLILRLTLYFRPLKDFKSHFLFGIALPYLGILSFWSVHIIHAGADINRLLHMLKYWDFPISSLLIFVFLAHIFYRSYKIFGEICEIERNLLSLPHRRFGRVRVLKTEKPIAFTLGILRPRLFLSEGILKLERDLKNLIISHEINHIKSFDNLKVFLFSLLFPSRKELSLLKAHLEILNDRKVLRKYPKSTLINALILSLYPPRLGLGITDEIYLRLENLEKNGKGNPLVFVLFALFLLTLLYLSNLNCKG
ncbi:MAG: M48 family metalloprotease [Candidatus Caldipriscus sp.]